MAGRGTIRAWLVGLGAIIMTLSTMGPFILTSLYINAMTVDLGVTVGQISIALSIRTVSSMVAAFTIGKIVKALNHRIIILGAAVCVFAVQFTISVSTSIIPIYLIVCLNGFGTVWGGMAMGQIAIAQWFAKGRGMMMSACMVALSLMLTVCFPIVSAQIETYGYRPVVMVIGIIASIGVAISAFLVSGSPEKHGVLPLGADKGTVEDVASVTVPSLSWKSIYRGSVFWAIIVIVVLGDMVFQGYSSQSAVIYGTLGLDEMSAAFAMSLFTFLCIPSQFIFGFLCDRTGPKWALGICGGVSTVVLLCAFLLVGWTGAVILACGLAFSAGLTTLYGPNAALRIFGPREAGEIVGMMSVASSAGATIGPLVFGFTYDGFGSYSVALTIMGIALAVCLYLNFWVHSKKNREMIQQQIAFEDSLQASGDSAAM